MKNQSIYIVILILLTIITRAQELKIRSNTGSVDITKDPPVPPELSIIKGTFQFKDGDGNNAIDANETCIIKLELENTGRGEGRDLLLKVSEKNGIKGLEYTKSKQLGNLQPDKKIAFDINISGSMALTDGEAAFIIKIDEANGMGADAVETPSIKTYAFKSPLVRVSKHQISKVEKSGSNQLRKKMPFNLEIQIENAGAGKAKNLSVELIKPEGVNCYSGNIKSNFDDIIFKPSEKKIITYQLYVTENFEGNSVPFKVIIKESYNKYGENKDITVNINDDIKPDPLPPIKPSNDEITVINDDLLKDIPKGEPDNNKIVVIIANSNYQNKPAIPQAENVLDYLKQYFASIYGLNIKDIIVRENMTNDNLRVFFYKSAQNNIFRLVKKDKEIIIYYIGHGGVTKDGKSYLCGTDSQESGYNINDLTALLDASELKSYSLIVDACYSADKGTQGEAIIEIGETRTNGVYFASSKNNEVSNIYEEENLTYFSYFFMKTLKELANKSDIKEISFEQVYTSMLDPIKTFTFNKIKRIQEPVITGKKDNIIMKLKR